MEKIKKEFGDKPVQTTLIIVGGFVALVWTLIQIISWVDSKIERLDVVGKYTNLSLPGEFDKLGYISFDYPNNEHVSTSTFSLLADFLESNSYWEIGITNNYSKKIESVYLKTSLDGLYSMDGGKTVARFSNEIFIGDLKPEDHVGIVIYARDRAYGLLVSDTIKVTYEGGVVDIGFPTQIDGGFWVFVYKIRYYLMYLFVFILCAGSLTFSTSQKSLDRER